ncbi:MAG: hypothetical protein PWQ17_1388 [Anaerophaga sp.]|jgi:hypothetical protein|nr:hypothetical protein [Anaerophaga sp.]
MREVLSVLTYNEILEKIKGQVNHLLIGNGFNYGLGINTGYKSIFQKMIENKREVYSDAMPIVESCNYDLEIFIGKLEEDIVPNNTFLRKYIRNKVKFDFMQAVHEIVKAEIKSIYVEKNEGIFLLLQNFTNYFSLNYDSFLYLLLLKYKPISNELNNTIVFQPSIKFMEEDMNEKQNNIYREIKEARHKGELEINVGDESKSIKKPFCILTRSHFSMEVKEYSKTNKKGWKTKDIDKVVKSIFEEEERNRVLNKVDDGFRQLNLFGNNDEFIFDVNSKTQNIFFLHGAFHIHRDGSSIKKITQKSDKALYDRLEKILNTENQEIICVFQHEDKTEVINGNKYLLNCLEKLRELSGNMVIIGSSLADNDNHIFEQINKSAIETVYISTMTKEKEKHLALARQKFPSKEIYLFDAETISYVLPESN